MENNNSDNPYNLDENSLKYCNFREILDQDPRYARELYKDVYKKDLEKYKHKVFNFEMPKEVNNGEPVECLFYYPDDSYLDEQKQPETSLPVTLYIHGGGFVVDGLKRLPSDLSKLTNSVVVYPSYSLSPEYRYPISVEQCYNVLLALKSNKYNIKNLDTNSISLFGESAGGSIAAALSILVKQRNLDLMIQSLVLVYSILNDDWETESYNLFAKGFYLTKACMKYCYKNYLENIEDVTKITCCPGKATLEELSQMPVKKTLIITAECDVLRSDNELYAKKLFDAKNNINCIRVSRVIHGFLAFEDLIDSDQGQLGLKIISNFMTNNNNYDNVVNEAVNNKAVTKII